MRRSICSCEPHSVLAGAVATWKFSYTTATPLPKGCRLKFDLLSQGKETDWQIPRTSSKEKNNLIWLQLPEGKTVLAKEIILEDRPAPAFEFTLPSEVKTGETLVFYMGAPEKGKGDSSDIGNRAQIHVQRRRPFHLYIDPKGKGDYKDPEVFTLDVRGNALTYIRIIAPSLVSKNKRFDVVIRFEDVFGNLTNNAPEGTLIEVSYEHLRENLNWKLFIPETGFINLPNLYFNEEGIYKIQLRNLQNQELFLSSPIKCLNDCDKEIYWGWLHGESEKIDAAENIEGYLRHLRDERNMQYVATSPFESQEEVPNDIWKNICHQVADFNEDFRFITFLGFQFFDDEEKEGLRQIIYAKDTKPILRKKESKSSSLKKIYKTHSPKEILSIPSFSMGKGWETSFSEFNPEYERVVEIYNAWGSSECSSKEDNPRPIATEDRKGISESEKGSIRRALNNNCRFGFVAGGLDDRGIYADFYESSQVQYSAGLTAIIAIEQTREALWQALQNRSCYATTGERIVLGFSIAGAAMGCELNTKAKPGLQFNRHLTGYIAGTESIKAVEIIRNGSLLHTFNPQAPHFDFAFDDSELLQKIALPPGRGAYPFAYYYLRIIQEDDHMAWSSPIWIDLIDSPTTSAANKKKKG